MTKKITIDSSLYLLSDDTNMKEFADAVEKAMSTREVLRFHAVANGIIVTVCLNGGTVTQVSLDGDGTIPMPDGFGFTCGMPRPAASTQNPATPAG